VHAFHFLLCSNHFRRSGFALAKEWATAGQQHRKQEPHHLDCSTIRNRSRLQSGVTRKKPLARASEPTNEPTPIVECLMAVRAAESKKAEGMRLFDLREVTSFTDYFLICSASNPRQSQAICDEVALQLKKHGRLPLSVEGYENAEWILADYGDYIVHIFSEKARDYYDLERLWRSAKEVEIPDA